MFNNQIQILSVILLLSLSAVAGNIHSARNAAGNSASDTQAAESIQLARFRIPPLPIRPYRPEPVTPFIPINPIRPPVIRPINPLPRVPRILPTQRPAVRALSHSGQCSCGQEHFEGGLKLECQVRKVATAGHKQGPVLINNPQFPTDSFDSGAAHA